MTTQIGGCGEYGRPSPGRPVCSVHGCGEPVDWYLEAGLCDYHREKLAAYGDTEDADATA